MNDTETSIMNWCDNRITQQYDISRATAECIEELELPAESETLTRTTIERWKMRA